MYDTFTEITDQKQGIYPCPFGSEWKASGYRPGRIQATEKLIRVRILHPPCTTVWFGASSLMGDQEHPSVTCRVNVVATVVTTVKVCSMRWTRGRRALAKVGESMAFPRDKKEWRCICLCVGFFETRRGTRITFAGPLRRVYKDRLFVCDDAGGIPGPGW